MKHKKIEKHKMESEMKFNLRQRLQTGTKNVSSMKTGGHFDFFMLLIYCKTTSNPLISTRVNKLMINYHFLCYFCESSAILDFTILKILLWISRVNKFCVASPDLIQDRGTKIFW